MPFGPIKLMSAIIATSIVFFVLGSTSFAATDKDTNKLNQKVLALTQQCSESSSNKQLQQTISEASSLSEQIKESQHLKKKLFIIRMKQTRNLCEYYLQLSSTKNANLPAK